MCILPLMKWKETWELPSIPDPVFWPEVGRRRGQGGGRPKTLKTMRILWRGIRCKRYAVSPPSLSQEAQQQKSTRQRKNNHGEICSSFSAFKRYSATIPTTRDAGAHTGLVIFDCFEKIIELNKTEAGKPRGKRATNQVMKLLATAMNGKEQLWITWGTRWR